MSRSSKSSQKSLVQVFRDFITSNKKEVFILSVILLVSSFLRLFKISEYMTFLGDEGRDVIVVRRFLTDFDPILIGPGTSIGNMYLGPLYYYLMAIPLLLANFSPVGPAVMVAVLGILTVFLVWKVTSDWFPTSPKTINVGALVAAGLYGVSSTVVHFSRSSWNPNVMPFFTIVCLYSIWKVYVKSEYKWLIGLGISYAFVLQSHYLGLLLFPVFGVFWILKFLEIRKVKENLKLFVRQTIFSTISFLILMSPLLIFDLRHNFMNFNSLKLFLTERQTTVSARPWTGIPKIPEIAEQITTSLAAGNNDSLGSVVTLIITLSLTIYIFGYLTKKGRRLITDEEKSMLIILLWAGFGLIGLGVYKQHIYDHYFGFVFPIPFIAIGVLTQGSLNLIKKLNIGIKVLFWAIIIMSVGTLVKVNLKNSWIYKEPVEQLSRSEKVAQKMIEESEGKKFNMAVIAERNYEGAYQYFLEKNNANFVMIDPQREKETVTDQLFVVCELPREKCDPTTNPKAGIANFGWSKIDREWNHSGVILFRLIHSKP